MTTPMLIWALMSHATEKIATLVPKAGWSGKHSSRPGHLYRDADRRTSFVFHLRTIIIPRAGSMYHNLACNMYQWCAVDDLPMLLPMVPTIFIPVRSELVLNMLLWRISDVWRWAMRVFFHLICPCIQLFWFHVFRGMRQILCPGIQQSPSMISLWWWTCRKRRRGPSVVDVLLAHHELLTSF
jgi:hypothetical protein